MRPGRAKFTRDRTQDYADVTLVDGVTLELVRTRDTDFGWEVWAIRIDGTLYREPRDLQGEPLADGPFLRWLDTAFSGWSAQQAVAS